MDPGRDERPGPFNFVLPHSHTVPQRLQLTAPCLSPSCSLHTFAVDSSRHNIYTLWGVKFAFQTQGPIRSVPAFLNTNLFVGSGDGTLYCLDAESGIVKWKYVTGGAVNSSPAVGNGMAYCTNKDRHVYALRASDGKLVWNRGFGSDLPYRNGFDYYTSSPTLECGIRSATVTAVCRLSGRFTEGFCAIVEVSVKVRT